jgi:L-lactate dehydrogenase complex protein LldG
MTSDSRSRILERVRKATASTGSDLQSAYARIDRNYIREGKLGAQERVALMIERLREYDADVLETSPHELSGAISTQLKAGGRHRFVAPEGVPAAWMPEGFEWKVDRGLSASEIEHCEGVLTGAFCGIADSGTIVLHHGAREGRRVISLLPDWHLCVLNASQIVETLPEYFARCDQAPVLATYISGPSATADIEMTRIKGVHGPRFLNVIVVDDLAHNQE